MANLGSDQLVEKLEEYDDDLNPLRDHLNKEKLEKITTALSVLQTDEGKVTADEHKTLSELYLLFTEVEDQISSRYDEDDINKFNSHTFTETVFVGLLRNLQEEKLGKSNSNPHKFPKIKNAGYHTEEELSLETIVIEIMARYPETPEIGRKIGYSEDKPAMQYLEKFQEKIEKWSEPYENIQVNKSGVGGWAATPWIAALDTRNTTSTKRGTYIVFFVDPRQNKFYLTLGQGTQELNQIDGGRGKKETLRDRAEEIQKQISLKNFKKEEPDLSTESRRDKFYPPSTALHKDWTLENLPTDKKAYDDFSQLLQKYQKWIYSWEDPTDYLKFNPNAKPRKVVGSPDHFITSAERRCWGFEDISDDISEGDVVIIHASSKSKHDDLKNMRTGLIGVGIVEEGVKDYKNQPWWLAEFTSASEWPDILKFKKMFLTGDTEKLDLSRNVYQKFKEDKEILNEEMEALLKNSVGREKADEIAQEVNEENKGFPWRVNGGRFLDSNKNVCYELPIRIIEEMMNQ